MKLPERDKSTGSSALLAALVVMALIITTVYYREADTGPVHSLRQGVKAVTAPVAQGGEVVTRPFRATVNWFSGFGVRREELEALSAQNAELRRTVAELEEARQENERLKDLIGFVQARELEAVGAHVIGRPSTSWEHSFIVDRGTDDGLDIGMPVLGSNGLLGQTVLVTARSATVRLLADQRSGVAALLQSSRGYRQWHHRWTSCSGVHQHRHHGDRW
jgi:rod shape-determining protein MreC